MARVTLFVQTDMQALANTPEPVDGGSHFSDHIEDYNVSARNNFAVLYGTFTSPTFSSSSGPVTSAIYDGLDQGYTPDLQITEIAYTLVSFRLSNNIY